MKDHWEYRLTAIDSKSTFVLAKLGVIERTLKACLAFLQQIKSWCYTQILEQYKKEQKKPAKKRKLIIFVSDKFWNYKAAWKKLVNRTSPTAGHRPAACSPFGLGAMCSDPAFSTQARRHQWPHWWKMQIIVRHRCEGDNVHPLIAD